MREVCVVRTLLLAAALCLVNTSASAYLSYGNQPLHHAIWPQHAQKLIVAGEIAKVRQAPPRQFDGPPQVEITFRVGSVILGSPDYAGRRLDLDVSSFAWPKELVQLDKSVRCIFVLGQGTIDGKKRLSVVTVVPTRRLMLKHVDDGEQAKRILENEIISELALEKSPKRQTALLIQVAPILTRRHVEQVVPFATSDNAWVKRAALAGLIYATEDEQYLRPAAIDVQAFMSTTTKNDLIDGRYSAHGYFFRHYFFLSHHSWRFGSRWNEAEAKKHLRILHAMFDLGVIDATVTTTLNPRGE